MNNTYKFPVSQHGPGGAGVIVHLPRGLPGARRTTALPHPCTPALLAAFLLFAAAPVRAQLTDRDGDGIPRDWEILRGTSDSDAADALVDFDGDGLTTYMEYLTRGRPWGNYAVHRFPWRILAVPFSGLTGAEIIGANRAGEYLVNCYDAAGPHTFLWSPGMPAAKSELIPLPLTLAAGTLWNDLAQVLLPGPVAGSGEIRNLRRWHTPPIAVSWNPQTTPVALSNDGQLLLHWQEWTPLPSPSKRPVRVLLDNFLWSSDSTVSEILSFGRDPSRATIQYGAAADLTSGAWILGAYQFSFAAPETIAWRLRPAAPAESLPPLPRGLHGAAFFAAAAEKAAGAAHRDDAGPHAAVLLDVRGWHLVSGGVAGASPHLFGVSDAGIVLGLNTADTRYFLWNTIAVDLAKARPDTSVIPAGLTASGALYGLDFGKGATPPRPVVFHPLASVIGDGAADVPTDTDHDGIPDANEPAAGTSPSLLDTDGNGQADLWDLVSRPSVATSAGATPGPNTGLQVFSPGHHPLARHAAARP